MDNNALAPAVDTPNVPPTGPATAPASMPKVSLEKIKAYHRLKRSCHIGSIVISVAYWGAWCAMALVLGDWLDDRGIQSRWLSLLASAAVMIIGSVLVFLPINFYDDYTLEKRFGLSNQRVKDWLVFQLKSWLVGGVLAAILLAGLFSAFWYAGPWWGVYVWVGVMLLSVVLAKVFPLIILPLFYPSKPLDRPSLTNRLTAMAQGTGMKVTGVFNLGLSKDTKKANAMLAGLGSSRRVYLSDTLLEAFNDEQILVVFAHELGHHLRRHMLKSIALTAVVSSVLVWLICGVLNPYAVGTPGNIAPGDIAPALALVMFTVTIFPLLVMPITNGIGRHFERQADWLALKLTNAPAAYRSAFELLTRMNLADPDPPRWEEIIFDDHPAMSKRIAMAEAYEKRA